MSEAALRARGLVKRFGALAALRGVDLEVGRGTIHAILGPNGAGKTTLLRILAGLSRPSGGEVKLVESTGNEVEPRKARSVIGYVGHATLLYAELSARENLLFAAKLYGVTGARERADALLEAEGLFEVAEVRVGTFSRGMAQRLAIARACIHDPQIILLDEPFTGLDRRAADRLAARLDTLRSQSRALVLITHDLRRAAELADRVDTLIRGKVAFRASGAEITPENLEASVLGPAQAGGIGA
ncbi:MAG: ABC transporter ATP-binding protein [Myxococcales bacterium]|nr:ABC transporter ATP-binding protein [Myxococcales bacterium]